MNFGVLLKVEEQTAQRNSQVPSCRAQTGNLGRSTGPSRGHNKNLTFQMLNSLLASWSSSRADLEEAGAEAGLGDILAD